LLALKYPRFSVVAWSIAMTFSSKKLRYSIAVVVFLALTLVSLRVYGLFINERKEALLRAERATEQSGLLKAEAQQIEEQADSHFNVSKAELPTTASPNEKVRIYVEWITSSTAYLSRQNTALLESARQRAYASAEREYAANHWLITKHILYRLWMTITGVTESDDDRISFISANTKAYPKAKISMLDRKLVGAQACNNRTIVCNAACKWSTSVTQVMRCVDACGRCDAEWQAAATGWDSLFDPSKVVESQIPANEASAIATIRKVNEAEMIYASEHPNLGFSPDIPTVGGIPNEDADPATTRSKNGYSFTYIAGEQVNHAIRSYTIAAIPNQVGRTGVRSFYSDETGEIHFNARGPADVSNPVVGD
jgi:hypothetical protein